MIGMGIWVGSGAAVLGRVGKISLEVVAGGSVGAGTVAFIETGAAVGPVIAMKGIWESPQPARREARRIPLIRTNTGGLCELMPEYVFVLPIRFNVRKPSFFIKLWS